MNMRTTGIAVAALVAASGTHAQVVAIDEFEGDVWDGFELIAPPGQVDGPVSIMEGAATINDSLTNFMMIAWNLFSGLTETEIAPYNGGLMAGSVTGWSVIEFATPVSEFGGYIGTADVVSGGSVALFGADGELLDAFELTVGVGEWEWYGWSSAAGIHRIEIYGGETPGTPLVFDDFRATLVPTPGVVSLLGLAGVGALRRRR